MRRHLWLVFLLVLCSITVVACSDDAPAHGGGPTRLPALRDEAPPGVLRVRVVGLVGKTEALIDVAGTQGVENIERRVKRDVDIPLPAGRYTVHAGAVAAADAVATSGYRPKTTVQEAAIDDAKGAVVTVEYERVDTKISPLAKPASPALASSLASVSTDTSGRTTLVFTAATAESSAWAVGDIALFPSTVALPQGHFGRIVSTDGKTVVTEPASMQDVVEEGVFAFDHELDLAKVVEIVPTGAAAAQLTVCNSLTWSLPASRGVASVALNVIGDLCFYPEVAMSLAFKGKLVPDVYFRVGAGVGASLTVEGAATIGIGIEIPIFTIRFASFTIFTGPIPWVITPEVTLRVGANGQVTAGVRAGMTATGSAWGGFSYDSRSNTFSKFGDKSSSFTVVWPEPFATAQVKGYGGPQLTLLVDGVAGPTITLDGYVTFDVDFLRQPLWQLHAGLELSAGLATTKLLNLEYKVPIFTYDKIIAQSTDTPPIGAKVGGRDAVSNGESIVVGPDDTIYTTAGKEIRAYKKNGPVIWTYTGADFISQIARGPDGTLYARDFGGVYYALNANGTEKWKSVAIAGGSQFAVGASALWAAKEGGVASLSLSNGAVTGGTDLDAGVFYRGVAIAKDGTIYVIESAKLHAVAPGGGLVWTANLAGTFTGGLAIAADGTIYVVEYVGGVGVGAIGANGVTKWTREVTFYDQPTAPVIGSDGTLYVCGTNPSGGCTAVDTNGNVKWRFYHNEVQKAPPALGTDGKLYLVTDRSVRAIATSNGAQALRVELPATSDPRASPSFLSTKDLVVGKGSTLYVYYAGATLATSPWPRGGGDASGSGRGK